MKQVLKNVSAVILAAVVLTACSDDRKAILGPSKNLPGANKVVAGTNAPASTPGAVPGIPTTNAPKVPSPSPTAANIERTNLGNILMVDSVRKLIESATASTLNNIKIQFVQEYDPNTQATIEFVEFTHGNPLDETLSTEAPFLKADYAMTDDTSSWIIIAQYNADGEKMPNVDIGRFQVARSGGKTVGLELVSLCTDTFVQRCQFKPAKEGNNLVDIYIPAWDQNAQTTPAPTNNPTAPEDQFQWAAR